MRFLKRVYTYAHRRKSRTALKVGLSTVVIVFAGLIFVFAGSLAPKDFPYRRIVTIPKSSGVSGTAEILADRNIIKSPFLFKVYVVLLGGTHQVQAGDYLFDEPQSALRVVYRTVHGEEGLTRIKVTIPEGLASPDVARFVEKNIPGFDRHKFLALAQPFEGQLFPDTYFFYENTTPEEVIEAMHKNFDSKTRNYRVQNTISKRSWNDVLAMASIIEEEANNPKDRRMISGILWKRIDAGMALQVDAPFFYIFGKASNELTRTDLATTSLYNTYTHKGLPPKPISNPGLDAISAAMNPEKNPYWFYLADFEGVTHYSATHEEHVEKKQKYL
ncbi:MAG: endolytic transglycosylase MltG [Patescibacteria group bacterium]